MRIDDFAYHSPYKTPQAGSDSKADFRIEERQAKDDASSDTELEDVVQLTLGQDGVWEVRTAAPSGSPSIDTSQRFSHVLPRVTRLYHSFWRVYSPEGITQALERSTGTLVDLYA